MAILNSIRKRGLFLIIIIALALFSFVLSDLFKGGSRSMKGEANIATINGVDVSRETFMKKVEVAQRNLRGRGTTTQAMNSVWNQELRRVLLDQQYESLGLTAESEQIKNSLRKVLANNPTFQDELGNFSEAKLQEYLANIKGAGINGGTSPAYQQWLDFEKSTEQNLLEQSYFNLIKGGLITTLAEGEQEYHFQNDQVNIQYAHIPYTKIADEEVEVTDAEITAYVKSHAKEFEVDPQVDIQYVSFEEKPSPDDIDAAREDMLSLLKDKEEYNSVTKNKETVLGFTNTKDIESFVNANSDVAYSDKWLFEKEIPITIKDTLKKLSINQIYGPYKVGDRYNLTKLIGVKKLPDSAKVRHILIAYKGLPSASADVIQTKEEAKATADSLLGVLKRDRSKFAKFVTDYSSDQGSVKKGGRYDWFPYNAMVPNFRDFAFEKKTGDLGVVETPFGFHIIEVEGQKNFQDVYKVATITKNIEPSEKTSSQIFSDAANFEVDSKKGDFNEIAKEKSMTTKPVNKIGELDANIPGIGENRSIVTWAFKEDTNIGDIKRFNLPSGGGYAVVQLTRRNPKALMSVAEASTKVLPILRNKKKAEKIRASISSSDMNEIAKSQNVKLKTASALTMASPTIAGAGNEPKVVGAAFGTKEGETTGLIDGETGVFMVKVLKVKTAPEMPDYTSFANQLNNKELPSINKRVFDALKNVADIDDNRANFY
ncbi:MAG: peptidylprolyl isomerase [Flavobacteriales bacterium]